MKRYLIEYSEAGEIHQWTCKAYDKAHACKAYDKAHAVEKFLDPEAGFTLDMIRRIVAIR